MREADYYPAGAYNDPSAPFNEPIVPERSFDVCISQTLSRSITVTTDKYQPEYDDENGHIYASTEDTDWRDVYKESDCHTPLELIKLFGECLKAINKSGQVFITPGLDNKLIDECEGWCEDELEVIEE